MRAVKKLADHPWYKPCSLRGKLLLWLVTLHLIAAGAAACASYMSYGRMVHTFMDDQMRLLANSYAANDSTPVLQPLADDGVYKWGSFIVQIFGPDGRLLATSWPKLAVPLQAEPGLRNVRTGAGRDEDWRVFTAEAGTRAGQPRVQIAQSGSFLRHEVAHRALFAALPIALLLPVSLAVLWLVVWLSSYSLHAVAREVAAQDERSLSELSLARVPDEIAPLVGAFNSLLARLRDAFAAQRRFVQDAAHELRTPVAAIGLQLENLRAHVPSGDAAERFAQLEAGVTRAQHLIEQLLRLSRQESASPAGGAEPVDVAALLRESLGQLMVVADRRHIDVGFDGSVTPVVSAPAAELRSVFDNLIDNALRHAPEGGVVDVRLHEVQGQPVVDVVDNGPGIPPEFMGRVFDRFFRVPGTSAGGSGLGLAIARTAALRHGLRIALRNRSEEGEGTGLIARVYLPV
ncbi:sensor histidine kinase [Variovorax sp. JS1663]|uniref:sensor histidine kinase n=1 Tax=Variovorax sp. JS1663 TaxID=1851577 RepID=UPI000B342567|nr:ATP-binding protein [Variovorax sp. JS1663]OUL99215.1 two-component sensor histidine kinase [Variovorax sp. JS1663]